MIKYAVAAPVPAKAGFWRTLPWKDIAASSVFGLGTLGVGAMLLNNGKQNRTPTQQNFLDNAQQNLVGNTKTAGAALDFDKELERLKANQKEQENLLNRMCDNTTFELAHRSTQLEREAKSTDRAMKVFKYVGIPLFVGGNAYLGYNLYKALKNKKKGGKNR